MAENRQLSRLEGFSDGVFAIAITLLILEVKVPPLESLHSPNALWAALVHLWPSYFAFAFSFGSILVLWINLTHVFTLIEKSSKALMYANGFILLTITFVPFPTALLAEYILTPYMQQAIVFYCGFSIITTSSFIIFFHILLKPQLLIKHDTVADIKKLRTSAYFGLLVYICSTALAWWFPITALVINTSLWILWVSLSLMERNA